MLARMLSRVAVQLLSFVERPKEGGWDGIWSKRTGMPSPQLVVESVVQGDQLKVVTSKSAVQSNYLEAMVKESTECQSNSWSDGVQREKRSRKREILKVI